MYALTTALVCPGWLRRMVTAAFIVTGLGIAAGTAQAGASLVLDGSTGQVLNQVNADEANHPASLTKMMTLYLVFQALQNGHLKMDQQLPVSAWASAKAPTKLGLKPGSTISVRDCILGMITKSANDAATVAAEALGGSEERFITSMNAQALMLGMSNTHFGSASGLPNPYDTTTARDIGKLAMALYRDFPVQAPLFATKEFMFQGRLVRGHNHLMDRYEGMDGLKTGYTGAAGFNLASTAIRDGHRLFGVVLGGRTAGARDQLMARLLDNGFANRPTDPQLVAAAGRPERGVTHRVLAALSPIDTAEAEPVARVKGHRAVARKKPAGKAVASRHATALAKASNACPSKGSRRAACLKRAKASAAQLAKQGHGSKASQLAKAPSTRHVRHHGKSMQVASSRKRVRD